MFKSEAYDEKVDVFSFGVMMYEVRKNRGLTVDSCCGWLGSFSMLSLLGSILLQSLPPCSPRSSVSTPTFDWKGKERVA
eukprot:scaffold156210_cov15-Tisochrysis_lutea.AAC.1